MTTRWWHAYKGGCEHVDVITFACEATMHPEQLVAEGVTSIHYPDVMCAEKCEGDVFYVRSWDHEPSDAERELAGLGPAE